MNNQLNMMTIALLMATGGIRGYSETPEGRHDASQSSIKVVTKTAVPERAKEPTQEPIPAETKDLQAKIRTTEEALKDARSRGNATEISSISIQLSDLNKALAERQEKSADEAKARAEEAERQLSAAKTQISELQAQAEATDNKPIDLSKATDEDLLNELKERPKALKAALKAEKNPAVLKEALVRLGKISVDRITKGLNLLARIGKATGRGLKKAGKGAGKATVMGGEIAIEMTGATAVALFYILPRNTARALILKGYVDALTLEKLIVDNISADLIFLIDAVKTPGRIWDDADDFADALKGAVLEPLKVVANFLKNKSLALAWNPAMRQWETLTALGQFFEGESVEIDDIIDDINYNIGDISEEITTLEGETSKEALGLD